MQPEPTDGTHLDNPSSRVDAALQRALVALAADLRHRTVAAHTDQLPDVDTPCSTLKERLNQKRQEFQEYLDIANQVMNGLKELEAASAPAPNELRLRILVMKGSAYDFTRVGRNELREKLEFALQRGSQILETEWGIVVEYGPPELAERSTETWEFTTHELWKLGDRFASDGTPVLLFADRVLLPEKTLPHSWGQGDRTIACVTEGKWISDQTGLLVAHNIAHLLGLNDSQQGEHLMSHDAMRAQLTWREIEQLRQRAAERAIYWAQENAAACQQGIDALDPVERTVTLLENHGDSIWQLYRTCIEKTKETPPLGVAPLAEDSQSPVAWSDLVQRVERLAQKIARAEEDLDVVKTMLAGIQSQLSALSDESESSKRETR